MRARAVAGNGKRRVRKKRISGAQVRARLADAEATLDAIRTGRVDALVVSGPQGDQTRTIEGATHPYFVLLNAMSDGAALLEPEGTILFGNLGLGDMVGAPVEALLGSSVQLLVAPAERPGFEEFLRAGCEKKSAREFTFVTRTRSAKPVAVSLSPLPLGSYHEEADTVGRDTLVLMAIVMDLTHTKAAEATRARLLQSVVGAEDDERRRIARELHDETGQSLTALVVGLRTIAEIAAVPEVRRIALQLRDVAAQTVDDVGRLGRGLHPAVLDDMGLAAAARRYVLDYARSFETPVNFTVGDVDSPRLAPLAAATAYRILQEALTNVARHARAKKVDVAMKRDRSALELMIRDDGVGFDVTRTFGEASGLGLHGMRERVTLLGGSIQIESGPRSGTVVRARIPARAKAPGATSHSGPLVAPRKKTAGGAIRRVRGESKS